MHKCPVASCDAEVADEMLMCLRHWRMVPRPLGQAVISTWKDRGKSLAASQSYRANRAEAIRLVDEREGPASAGLVRIEALTVYQPLASLIAIGAKPWEFRGRPCPYYLRNGRVAIHAAARPVGRVEVADLLVRLSSPNHLTTGLLRDIAIPFLEQVSRDRGAAPLSIITCTAKLGDSVRAGELGAELGLTLKNDSDRDKHFNWAWPLSEIRVVDPPIGAKGVQGRWTIAVPKEHAK